MITLTTFSEAQEVIGRRWREDQSPEQALILGVARDALIFISATGQRYGLEDFRTMSRPGQIQHGSSPLEDLLLKAETFFIELLGTTKGSPREQELLQLIIDSLRFIVFTRQHHAFDEYQKGLESDAPPLAVAAFETYEEAEGWLRNHPSPPDFAEVLIAGRYHDVVYDRETNHRRLRGNRSLRHYLAGLDLSGPAIASFATREEAEAWLRTRPEPVKLVKVSIRGAPYLVVHHSNLGREVLCPLDQAQAH